MRRLIIALAAVAALALPSTAFAGGVVLKVEKSSHIIAVAGAAKRVSLVHTPSASRLHVGQRVAVTARKLGNGTFRASKVRVVGKARTVRFRGLLLAKSASRWTVSAGGAVISVHRGSRSTSSARDGGPPVGSTVDVQATVGNDDELDDDDVTVVSAAAPGGTIEGRLTLPTTAGGPITVTSEHMSLVLKVPAGTDLTAFKNGQEVLADFSQGTDGTLTLTRLSTADDEEDTDEDHHDGDHHHGDHHDGDDHGGGGGHGGDGGDD
jgi:hypothetical protein